jgi:hypothetical protein
MPLDDALAILQIKPRRKAVIWVNLLVTRLPEDYIMPTTHRKKGDVVYSIVVFTNNSTSSLGTSLISSFYLHRTVKRSKTTPEPLVSFDQA